MRGPNTSICWCKMLTFCACSIREGGCKPSGHSINVYRVRLRDSSSPVCGPWTTKNTLALWWLQEADTCWDHEPWSLAPGDENTVGGRPTHSPLCGGKTGKRCSGVTLCWLDSCTLNDLHQIMFDESPYATSRGSHWAVTNKGNRPCPCFLGRLGICHHGLNFLLDLKCWPFGDGGVPPISSFISIIKRTNNKTCS